MQSTSPYTIPIARPLISDDDKRRVLAVLESGQLVAGPWVHEFEHAFSGYLGVGHGVATSSGTAALEIALEATGIGPGARVVTTPFSFVSTANAIVRRGAVPVFADIDPRTFNLDPASVAEAVERAENVQALLVVHLYGLPCPMDALRAIASRHGLTVIEDAAQAHGARYQGRMVGTFGAAGAFSFYPSKNLTTGEGGMVVTDDPQLASRAKVLVNVGQSSKYVYEAVGGNFRMMELAAALGIGQLAQLDERNAQRRRNANAFSAGLADLDWLRLPTEPPGCTHVFHQYTIRVPRWRDRLAAHLQSLGVAARVYYPCPIHLSAPYRERGFGDARCPEAERAAAEVLSVPVHPALEEVDVRRIVEAIRGFNPRH